MNVFLVVNQQTPDRQSFHCVNSILSHLNTDEVLKILLLIHSVLVKVVNEQVHTCSAWCLTNY